MRFPLTVIVINKYWNSKIVEGNNIKITQKC
ncbi:hypothetical protein SH1V18_44300 [Vallitalea longa]|uniref:Uncharacterized protein n=1 Tax=Vallitalea longa TaxID=2936439 RepID=A0A9W6DGS9_9FIRM|nr:hypothetical protein SH1V18_44300 [Vallitalea longa]